VTTIKARMAVGGAALLVGAIAVGAVLMLGGGNAGKATGTANVRSGQGQATDGPAPSRESAGTATDGSRAATTGGERAGGGTGEAPAQASQSPVNVHGILGQLEQAVTSGGQPRPLTREEVAAQLRSELQKIGINQP
jgi:hypothetical protein